MGNFRQVMCKTRLTPILFAPAHLDSTASKRPRRRADSKLVDRSGSSIVSAWSVFGGGPRQGSLAVVKEARVLNQQLQNSSSIYAPRDYLHIGLRLAQECSNTKTETISRSSRSAMREIDIMCRSFGWDKTVRQASVDISPNEEDDEISLSVPLQLHERLSWKSILISTVRSHEKRLKHWHFAPTASAKQFLESVLLKVRRSRDRISDRLYFDAISCSGSATLIDLLIQQLPLLQPRYYSIASSPVVSKRRIAIPVAVVVTYIPSQKAGNRFYGLTTNYLYSVVRKVKQISLQLPSTKSSQVQRPSFQVCSRWIGEQCFGTFAIFPFQTSNGPFTFDHNDGSRKLHSTFPSFYPKTCTLCYEQKHPRNRAHDSVFRMAFTRRGLPLRRGMERAAKPARKGR